MHRYVVVVGLLTMALPLAQSMALTAKQKRETCEIGAKAQNLTGQPRLDFINKCMSNKNDPRGPAAPAPSGAAQKPKS